MERALYVRVTELETQVERLVSLHEQLTATLERQQDLADARSARVDRLAAMLDSLAATGEQLLRDSLGVVRAR